MPERRWVRPRRDGFGAMCRRDRIQMSSDPDGIGSEAITDDTALMAWIDLAREDVGAA